jgi:hypothetical protein
MAACPALRGKLGRTVSQSKERELHLLFKKAVTFCFAPALLLASGCGSTDVELETPTTSSSAANTDKGPSGILVSPELFELVSQWASDSLNTGGVREKSITSGFSLSLQDYARSHSPQLFVEAMAVQALFNKGVSNIPTTQDGSGCTCQMLASFDKPSTYLSGNDANGNWSMQVMGAAHASNIYNSKSGNTTETVYNGATYTSAFKSRLMCTTPSGAACAAGCSAKLYADVQYSTQVYAAADTGGFWSKGAMAQLVDGATLQLVPPFGNGQTRLFEKAVSVSHYASSSTFDPNALAGVLKGALAIGTAIVTGDASSINNKLIDDTVTSFFGLRHHEGNDGSTSQGLIAKFESPFWQPIPVSYSSADNKYYKLDLASTVDMRVRGYGGWHRGQGHLASSYSMAVYVDNFVCDASVTAPPARSAFWRYDGYDGAAVPVSSLRERVGNFFYVAFGVRPDVSKNEGALAQGTCGDGICGGLESDRSCAVDCVRCGDNTCSQGESVQSCPGDCGRCGDGFCSSIENLSTCPQDCGWCGDGYCSNRETAYSCAVDCAYCGDGLCSPGEQSCSEDCGSCLREYCNPPHIPQE